MTSFLRALNRLGVGYLLFVQLRQQKDNKNIGLAELNQTIWLNT